MSLRAAALAYAQKGWEVLPLAPGAKQPLRGSQGVRAATNERGQVEAWWDATPLANIGIHCGPRSGLWVLDVDVPRGPLTLAGLEARWGPLPATLEARTARGGRHLVWRWVEGRDFGNRANTQGLEGLDTRAEGGYIVVEPSRLEGDLRYGWVNDLAPALAPAWLLDAVAPLTPPPSEPRVSPSTIFTPPPLRLERYSAGVLKRACERIAGLEDGRRRAIYAESYLMGQHIGAGWIDESIVVAALIKAGRESGTRHPVEVLVADGVRNGKTEPRQPPPDRPLNTNR